MKRYKPRASSIAQCARQNAFMMAGAEESNPQTPDATYTNEQGRIMEDLSIRALGKLGIDIVDRQVSLPDDFYVTGHPDGRVDGSRTGFEHKHFGGYKYLDIFKNGLEKAAPEVLVQIGCYAEGLGWDSALLLIIAQDASRLRGEFTLNQRAKNPKNRWSNIEGWNPKAQKFLIDTNAIVATVMPIVRQRAKYLTNWATNDGDPVNIKPEFNPEDEKDAKFPCGYCPYMDACKKLGQGGEVIPFLPFMKLTSEVEDE